jgi:sigma-54-dependent transcriptional regulator
MGMPRVDNTLIALDEFIKIATSLSTERDLKSLLHMIVTSARKITQAEAGRVYILDRTKRHLFVEVDQNDAMTARRQNMTPVPLFVQGKRHVTHVCAYCAFAGKLINIPDIYAYSGFDFRDVYEFDRVNRYRTRSLLAVPLRNHDEITIGVLRLANLRDPDTGTVVPFPHQLEGMVTAFASQAAVAIDNVQLITENKRLVEILERTNRDLERENQALRHKVDDQSRFAMIVGQGPRMQQLFSLMRKVFDSDATVLLRGETGTGKELVATTIHQQSPRRQGTFVVQNCAAMPENLLESEFFGYRRGAFTGATTDKKGLLELADGGTLFLDEIGDMPAGMQAKLLRVLQEGEVRPLGGVDSTKVNIRVIAATHRDLQDMVAAGTFREDLYYRLCVFPIDIPPLRQRKEDLPALLHYFLDRCATQYQKTVRGFTPRALDSLLSYDFPGNIRELQNIVERAVLLCDDGGSIALEHIPTPIAYPDEAETPLPNPVADEGSLADMVRHFESTLIEQKLLEHQGNQTKTARALKVPRRTLIEKMHRFNIKVKR